MVPKAPLAHTWPDSLVFAPSAAVALRRRMERMRRP